MPMKQWHTIPAVFRRNAALSCGAAIGSLLITVTVFFTAGDRILLYLGLVLFLMAVLKTFALMVTILTGSYETVTGICSSIDPALFSQNTQVHIMLTTGSSLTLTVNRRHHFKKEQAYLLYFKKGTPLEEPNSLWMQKAQTDALLAYEETDLESCGEITYI